MNLKQLVVEQIIEKLRNELELLAGASREMHADASDEQSKAEDKYDTRGLETAYLASAQARQAAEIEQALKDYESLELKQFADHLPIDTSALVELDCNGETTFYFIGPKSGGLEIRRNNKEIVVITPESPLGEQLMDKKVGDKISLKSHGPSLEFLVRSIT